MTESMTASLSAQRPPATLFVVATPIGNLDDLSARAAQILRTVTSVAAEDTRVSRTLLAHLGIRADIFPAHAHNEVQAAQQVLGRLQQGMSVALVTDAGTPAISDPGSRIVAAAHEAGFSVMPIPGASAVVALLSAAGLEGDGFRFIGFLPASAGARRRRLAEFSQDRAVLVLFEAPHRIDATIGALADAFGAHRLVVIGRELTKRFEEIARIPLGQAAAWLDGHPDRRRGEFALAIAPAPDRVTDRSAEPELGGEARDPALVALTDRLLKALAAELPAAGAARVAAQALGQSRQALYRRLLEIKDQV
jgi:16S rRNA (cytidine1402-2'-O)-methyltransferase